jgi:insertion element IS1 protein InsB
VAIQKNHYKYKILLLQYYHYIYKLQYNFHKNIRKTNAARGSSSRTRRDAALSGVKKTKVWIWKAYCRTTGQLVDWKCGDRSAATLKKILVRLRRLNVSIFFTDRWEAYAESITPDMLKQTKAETHGVERNNFRHRHWCGRFRRKTCIVSRSLLMIDLTVFLFSRFHVNG